MAKASDNLFPYVHLVPATAPASPAAGSQRLYLDSGNSNKLTRKDSSGTTTVVEGAGGSGTFIGARVYNSAAISVANNGALLTFDSERYDTDTIHSTSSNTGRLTATTAGKYQISGTVLFAGNATGARGLQIQLNVGGTVIAIERIPTVPNAGETTGLTISTTYDLAAGDYVQLFAYQTSGGALNVLAGGNYSPEFMMHKVG